MVNSETSQFPAIGACLRCNNLFLATSASPNCLLCGGAAAVILPFPVKFTDLQDVELVPAAPAGEPAAAAAIDFQCPFCGEVVTLGGTVQLHSIPVSPPAPPAEPAAAEPTPGPAAAPEPEETPAAPVETPEVAEYEPLVPTAPTDVTNSEEPAE